MKLKVYAQDKRTQEFLEFISKKARQVARWPAWKKAADRGNGTRMSISEKRR